MCVAWRNTRTVASKYDRFSGCKCKYNFIYTQKEGARASTPILTQITNAQANCVQIDFIEFLPKSENEDGNLPFKAYRSRDAPTV